MRASIKYISINPFLVKIWCFVWFLVFNTFVSYSKSYKQNIVQVSAGRDTTICTNTYQLNANPANVGETGIWTIPSGISISDINSPVAIISDLVDGNTYQLVWNIEDGIDSSKDTIYVTFKTTTVADAGENICSILVNPGTNQQAELTGTMPNASEISEWSVVNSATATNDSILLRNASQTTVKGLGLGSHILQYTITNTLSGCAQSDQVEITVINKAEISNAVTCFPLGVNKTDTTITLSGTSTSVGEVSTWKLLTSASSADIETASSNSTKINGLTRGTHQFQYLIENNGCKDSTDISIRIATKAQLPTDTCVKVNAIIDLIGTPVSSDESAEWSSVNGVISNPENYLSSYSNFLIGANKIFWKITDSSNICSSIDSMIVTGVSVPNAGNDTCLVLGLGQLSRNVVLNKFSYSPLVESVSNYSIEGDSIVGFGQNISVAVGPGIHSFVSVITNIATGCEQKDTVVYTVISKAQAGPSQCLIEPIVNIQLNASALAIGELGEWKSSLPLIFENKNSPSSKILNPPSGVLPIRWIVANGSCKDSSLTNISIISFSQVGNDTCVVDGAVFDLKAQAIDEQYQNGQWSLLQGGGEILNATQNNSSYTASANGINKLVWTIADTVGACLSRDTVSVVVTTNSVAGSDQCISTSFGTTNVQMQGNIPSINETGFWVNADSSSVILSYDPQGNLTLPIGKHTLIWSIKNNESDCVKSDTCVIILIEKPNAGSNQCLIEPINSVQLNALNFTPGFQNGIWKSNTPLIINNSGSFNANISNPPSGSFTLTWLVENEGCKDSASVRISIISKAVANQDICIRLDSNSQKQSISAVGINTIYQKGMWSASSINPQNNSPIVISDPLLNITSVSNLAIGFNKFYWTITDTSGFCSNKDSLVVTTVTKPVAMDNLCLTASIETFNADLSANNFYSGIESGYWVNKDSVAKKISSTNITNQQVKRGVNNFYWVIENQLSGCKYKDSVSVTLLPKALAGNNLCLEEGASPITLDANSFKPELGETGSWRNNTYINFADFSNPKTAITPLSSGVHTLTWSISNNGCLDSASSIVSLISKPEAGENICLVDNGFNNSTTLNANTFSSDYQNGKWFIKSGSGTLTNPENYSTNIENLEIGINQINWTLTDTIGFCSLTDSMFVTVNSKPTASTKSCQVADANNFGTVALSGNSFNSVFEKGYWSENAVQNFADSSLRNNTLTVNPSVYEFVWNIANLNGECATADTIEVTLLSHPSIDAQSKFPYCINGSLLPVSIAADTAWANSGEKGFWEYRNSVWGNISTSDSTLAGIDIKTENIGIHSLLWTIENNGCAAVDSIELSIVSSPDAGPDMCIPYANGNQTLINLEANKILSPFEKGRWEILQGSASFFTVTIQDRDSSSAKASGLLKGIDNYQWTVTDAKGRCGKKDTVTYALITPPNSGPDLCKVILNGTNSIDLTLKGNNPESSEIGQWSSLQTVTFSASNSTTTNLNLSQGHYIILWNISNPGLTSCRLSDTLRVTAISQAIAGEKQCLSTPAVNAILNGENLNAASGEVGKWSNVTPNSSAIIENPSNPDSKVSNLSTGAHRLKWVVNNNGCKDSSYTNLVLITKPDAGGNKCLPFEGENTVVTLTANPTTIADTSNWVPATNSLSGVSIDPNKNINNVTVFNKGAYTILYKIRDTAGICPFLEDSAKITILTKPALSKELCEIIPTGSNTKNVALTAGNSLMNQETGIWTSTTTVNFDRPNAVNSNALSVSTGKHYFVWKVRNNADPTCSISDTTLARVISKANAGDDKCLVKPIENTELEANVPKNSEKGYWKILTPQGQIQFNKDTSKSTVLRVPIGIARFRWYIANETCIDSSDVNVSVQTKSIAGSDFALCNDSVSLAGNNVATGESGYWSKTDSDITIADSASRNTDVYGLKPGNNKLVWTIRNAVCENSDTITVLNNQPSLVNISTPDQETCFTANVLTGNKAANEISTAKSVWRLIQQPVNNNPKVIINVTDSDSTVVRNLNAAGNYIFTYNIYNSVCDTIRDTVTIIRNESLYNFATGPSTACLNDTVILEGQVVPSDGEGKWILSGGYGTFENPLSNVTKVYDLATNQNLFYWRLKRGECENLQSVIIEGYAEPSPAVVLSKNEEVCQRDSMVLEAIAPEIGTGMWSIQSGSGKIESPTSNVTKVTQLGLGRNIFRWTITSGPCDSTVATVIIDRYAEETKAYAGKDTLLCGNNLTLSANAPETGLGSWRILQGSLHILNPTSPTSTVTNIAYKENILIWSITNGTCFSSDTVTIIADEPVDQAKVQEDIMVCGQSSIQISANNPTVGTGQWNPIEGVNPVNPNTNITTVQNLASDTSLYEWVIKKGFCETRDTLRIVNFNKADVANAGPDQSIYSPNTYLQANTPVHGQGSWQGLNDLIEISDFSNPQSYISNITKGTSAFVWTIKNGICPVSTDTVYVFYNNFRIPNAFSPNNDGKNDFFEVKGLQEYAPASIIIFNRWNEEVYTSKNYQNDWSGTNKHGVELVDDTYFYILTLANKEVHQGYIILKRK